MIIFGAGASYDSVNRSAAGLSPLGPLESLPLAQDLFDPRPRFIQAVARYQACAGLMAILRPQVMGGRDVEEALEEVAGQAERYPHIQRAMTAIRFYLRQIIEETEQDLIHQAAGVTNYASLLYRVEMWRRDTEERVILVTFNYDTLLDRACRDVLGLPLASVEDYVASDEWSLLKLHGSVDWGRGLWGVAYSTLTRAGGGSYVTGSPNAGMAEDTIIDSASDLELTDNFVRYDHLGRYYPLGDLIAQGAYELLLPAISVPVRSKMDFECPKSHVVALEDRLPDVDRILVIGWRGQEQHFLRLCRKALDANVPGLTVTGDNGANDAQETLTEFGGLTGNRVRPTGQGFTTFLQRDGLSRLFSM